MTARSVDYTSQIPASGSVAVGFQATYSGTNSIPGPLQCTPA